MDSLLILKKQLHCWDIVLQLSLLYTPTMWGVLWNANHMHADTYLPMIPTWMAANISAVQMTYIMISRNFFTTRASHPCIAHTHVCNVTNSFNYNASLLDEVEGPLTSWKRSSGWVRDPVQLPTLYLQQLMGTLLFLDSSYQCVYCQSE